MCTNRHPEYLCEFLEVLNKKVRAALSVVNHEELLLIRAKLDELILEIGDDRICSKHFFIKLHQHIDWFEDVKEELGLGTVS
jgi:hypothetical protein